MLQHRIQETCFITTFAALEKTAQDHVLQQREKCHMRLSSHPTPQMIAKLLMQIKQAHSKEDCRDRGSHTQVLTKNSGDKKFHTETHDKILIDQNNLLLPSAKWPTCFI